MEEEQLIKEIKRILETNKKIVRLIEEAYERDEGNILSIVVEVIETLKNESKRTSNEEIVSEMLKEHRDTLITIIEDKVKEELGDEKIDSSESIEKSLEKKWKNSYRIPEQISDEKMKELLEKIREELEIERIDVPKIEEIYR